MTLEQIENAEREIRKWFPPQTEAETPIWRRALEMLVSSAKTSIPIGQVAEDVDQIHQVVRRAGGPPLCTDGCTCATHTAISRLAAQAQSAETYRKERDEWREKWEGATQNEAKALEQARLGWERAAEKDRAYGDMIFQRDAALARCAELAAAGQVLSEHVDKAPECAGEPDCGWHNGGPCKACKRATGWTLRDEFALVVMHTVTVACKAELDDGRLSFKNIAKRSYGIADEMLKAREAK